MRFDPTTDGWWKAGFEPALRKSGYIPLRIDLVDHNDPIVDRILAEIRKSAIVVADLSHQRGGIYFEAGFAMGLSTPVVWTCKEDAVQELHFDVRGYNFIVWRDEADLVTRLSARVEALYPRKAD